ncbi:MAG: glycine cleavage system aminomethyltransferase GcvT [Caldicoprobacterales bacterium]|jgi:aminomethyltransferase
MEQLQKTPLYPIYKQYGARVVDFAGWALPIQYEGIIPEHHAVREAAGLFDVSHMGEVEIKGRDSLSFLDYILTNQVSRLKNGQIQYAIMANQDGGTLDDVLVYRFSEHHYWVIVNAANRVKDINWMKQQTDRFDVQVRDISDQIAQLAVQGPKAAEILKAAAGEAAEDIRFLRFVESLPINSISCLVSRTGYTGEDGFELYVQWDDAVQLWDFLMETGRKFGLKPAGLGCRDTLRFEACLPLYGNELDEDITPLEAGLGWTVKLEKPNFIGKAALKQQLRLGIRRKLAGFEMLERGIPRSGYEVRTGDRQIGRVTTGYFAPTLGRNLGLALLDAEHAQTGNTIDIMIRGKAVKAVIVQMPFYTKKYKK